MTAGRKVDRLDLLLMRGGQQVVAIEAKLYADLGIDQLHRYSTSFPDVEHRFVLHLAGLPLNHRQSPGWKALTWEAVLTAYTASEHPWVQATASAWLQELPSLVPRVDGNTVWNDVPDSPPGFELALRSRTAWIANRMAEWCTIEHSLEMSSGGGAWVAAMRAALPGTDHVVMAEVQEGLDAREWRPLDGRPYSERVRGPVVLVGLARFGAATSEGFDWALLHRVFSDRVVDDSGAILDGRPWSKSSANPRHEVDRENWQADAWRTALPAGWARGTAWPRRRPTACAPSEHGSSLQPIPRSPRSTVSCDVSKCWSSR